MGPNMPASRYAASSTMATMLTTNQLVGIVTKRQRNNGRFMAGFQQRGVPVVIGDLDARTATGLAAFWKSSRAVRPGKSEQAPPAFNGGRSPGVSRVDLSARETIQLGRDRLTSYPVYACRTVLRQLHARFLRCRCKRSLLNSWPIRCHRWV